MAINNNQSPADLLAADTQSSVKDLQATAEKPEPIKLASASGLKGLTSTINKIVQEGSEGATKTKKQALETEPNVMKAEDDFILPQDQKLIDDIAQQDIKAKSLISSEDYKIKSFETSDDIIKNLEVLSPNLKSPINKVTQKETAQGANAEMANILNMSKKWNKDNTIFTGSQVVAAKNAIMGSADSLKKIATAINGGDNSTATLYLFREQLAKHTALVQTFKSGRANVARALNAFKIPSDYKGTLNEFQELVLDELGGSPAAKLMAEHILDPKLGGNVRKLNEYVDGAWHSKARDNIMELYINGILSGPRTQLRNLIGNFFYQGLAIPETALAASFNALEAGLKKVGKEMPISRNFNYFNTPADGVTFKQLFARSYSYRYSVGKAWKAANASIKTIPDATKLETATYKRETISAANWGKDPKSYGGAGIDLLGKVIRMPGTALIWGDEFFKTIARSAEEGQMAAAYAEQLQRQGITNIDEIAEKTTEYLYTNPATKKAVDKAVLNKVFQDELGPAMKNISSVINSQRWLRVVIPFIRTPTNIYKAVYNYTAGAAIKAGQIPIETLLSMTGKYEPSDYMKKFKGDSAFRNKEMAKISIAGIAFDQASSMYDNGTLTGPYPRDIAEQNFWKENDIQPYSFVFGTKGVTDFTKPYFDELGRPQQGLKFVSYAGIEPFGSFFGIAATTKTLMQNQDNELTRDNIAIAATFATMDYFKQVPFLEGLATIYETVGLSFGEEPGDQIKAIEKIVKQYATTLVPYSGLLRGFETATSPEKNYVGPDFTQDLEIYKKDKDGNNIIKNGQYVQNPNFGDAIDGLGNTLMNDAVLFKNTLAQNLPGFSSSLAPKYGYNFQPIKLSNGMGGWGQKSYNMIVPFTFTKGKDLEAHELEVMRLGTPGYDGRKKTIMGIKFNDSQYSVIQQRAGEITGKGSNRSLKFEQALKKLVLTNRAYLRSDDKTKKNLLVDLRNEYVDQAFEDLAKRDPEFQKILTAITQRQKLINRNKIGSYQ